MEKPKLLIVAGPNGSGKTSVTSKILKGYFIRLFFIGTDHPRINAARIAHRVMMGVHDVPISKIVNRYSKSIINCNLLVPVVDRLYVYDNSVDDVFPQLLFRASDGKLTKQYAPINDWAKIIFQTTFVNTQ